nr:hypothetical protein [Tanacetum cinerariifolium]
MEEYIRIEEEKARSRGKVYNWDTAIYGRIWNDDDIHDLKSIETEFSAIVFNDMLTPEVALSDVALPPRDQRHRYLRFDCLEYTNADITDFEERLGVDAGSVNIPYLLAMYLRMFASWRKCGGLTMIVRDLPVIDMARLVRLYICEELFYTWDWVALGPERQPYVVVNTSEVAEGAPDVDEGA